MATVAQRTREQYSLVESYNTALQLLAELQTADIAVTVGFVAGESNPADALSRGKAPLLSVTSIGRG